MFGLTYLGIAHTLISLIAIGSGLRSLIRSKEFLLPHLSTKIYLVTTTLTAITALGIYEHTGKFGLGHMLAVLTLAAVAGGTLVAVTDLFGRWSRCLQALCYSSTLLFHVVPAVTEATIRLPPGNTLASRFGEEILIPVFGVIFLFYFVLMGIQLRWLWKISVGGATR